MLDYIFLVGLMITLAAIVGAAMFFFEWVAARFPDIYYWMIRTSTAVVFFGIILEMSIGFSIFGMAAFLFLSTPSIYHFAARDLRNFREESGCREQCAGERR